MKNKSPNLSIRSVDYNQFVIEFAAIEVKESPSPTFRRKRRTAFVFDILPHEVAQHVLLEWIKDMRCISSLDIACCNRICRPLLHQALSGLVAQTQCFGRHSKIWLKWLFARQMFVCQDYHLILDDLSAIMSFLPVFSQIRKLSLSKRSAHLETVTRQLCQRFFQYCSNATEVRLLSSLSLSEELAETMRRLPVDSLVLKASCPFRTFDLLLDHWGEGLTHINMKTATGSVGGMIELVAKQCPGLQSWSLGWAQCSERPYTSDTLLEALTHLPCLTFLDLDDGKSNLVDSILTDAFMQEVLPSVPKLQYLKLSSCRAGHDYSLLPALLKYCPQLHSILLNVAMSYYVQDGRCTLFIRNPSVRELLWTKLPYPVDTLMMVTADASCITSLVHQYGSTLRVLYNSYAVLDDRLLAAIAKQCPRLTSFESRRKQTIPSDCIGLRALAEQLGRQLLVLTLFFEGLTDEHMQHVLQCCPKLEKLELQFSTALTDLTFAALLRCCPSIKSVHIRGSSMTPEGIASHIIGSGRLLRPFQLQITGSQLDDAVIKRSIADALQGRHNPWRGKQKDGRSWFARDN